MSRARAAKEARRASRAAEAADTAELPPIRFRWDRARCRICGRDVLLTFVAPGDGVRDATPPADAGAAAGGAPG